LEILCFVKADWTKGLPLLAAGGEPDLVDLARKDLGHPATAQDQKKLADGWWAYAQKERKGARQTILEHAAMWYEAALPELPGLMKVAVENRLREVPTTFGRELLGTMQGPVTHQDGGAIVLRDGERIRTAQTFRPPVAFRIVVQTDSADIRIGYAADQIIFNWGPNPKELRVDGGPAGGRHKPDAGFLSAKEWHTIDLVVLTDALLIDVDGQERYRTKANFSKIAQPLTIFPAEHSTIKVRSVQVVDHS
jgi:hypothetical protein